MKGLPTCARVYFGMFLAALVFDVLFVTVAVITKQDRPQAMERVVYEIEEDTP